MPSTENSSETAVGVAAVPIELCQLLKFAGLVPSGGAAKHAIASGAVSLNGVVETQKRKKILAGDAVSFEGQTLRVHVEP